jgi:hypothetical protein
MPLLVQMPLLVLVWLVSVLVMLMREQKQYPRHP